MIWVRQEDPEGCGLAVLAMLSERTYAEVRADMVAFYHDAWDRVIDFSERGLIYMDLDRALGQRGFYVQHRYHTWPIAWPPEAFARMHYASVEQPSGRSHFVAVDADGSVLDPLREGRYRLADWPKVNQIVGVAAPGEENPPAVERPADTGSPPASTAGARRTCARPARGSATSATTHARTPAMLEYRLIVANKLGRHVTDCHDENDLLERLRSIRPGGKLENEIWVESRKVGQWGTDYSFVDEYLPDGTVAFEGEKP